MPDFFDDEQEALAELYRRQVRVCDILLDSDVYSNAFDFDVFAELMQIGGQAVYKEESGEKTGVAATEHEVTHLPFADRIMLIRQLKADCLDTISMKFFIKAGELEVPLSLNKNQNSKGTGAFMIPGLGKYGSEKSNYVMSVINTITKNNKSTEVTLARLMFDSVRTGQPITNNDLRKNNFRYNQNVVKQINRILYLAFVFEIARRFLGEVGTLPIAISQMWSLKLIMKGVLTMEQVFGRDARCPENGAPYGVPTAEKLDKKLDAARAKVKAINKLYLHHCFGQPKQKKIAIPTLDELANELIKTYGATTKKQTLSVLQKNGLFCNQAATKEEVPEPEMVAAFDKN